MRFEERIWKSCGIHLSLTKIVGGNHAAGFGLLDCRAQGTCLEARKVAVASSEGFSKVGSVGMVVVMLLHFLDCQRLEDRMSAGYGEVAGKMVVVMMWMEVWG